MDITDLVIALVNLKEESGDSEVAHGKADDLLLEYINNAVVTEAYNAIRKWYA